MLNFYVFTQIHFEGNLFQATEEAQRDLLTVRTALRQSEQAQALSEQMEERLRQAEARAVQAETRQAQVGLEAAAAAARAETAEEALAALARREEETQQAAQKAVTAHREEHGARVLSGHTICAGCVTSKNLLERL